MEHMHLDEKIVRDSYCYYWPTFVRFVQSTSDTIPRVGYSCQNDRKFPYFDIGVEQVGQIVNYVKLFCQFACLQS